MEDMTRRSAVALGLASVLAAPAVAQQSGPSPGIGRVNWGKRASMLPGYKNISMRDVVYQPGAKTSNPLMPNDMVCHVP